MQKILPTDKRIVWKNTDGVYKADNGYRLQRVPEEWTNRFPPGAAWRSLQSSNVRLLIKTDSSYVTLNWKVDAKFDKYEVKGEVFCDKKFHSSFVPDSSEYFNKNIFRANNEGDHLWEIHFPWCTIAVIEHILLGKKASLCSPDEDKREIMLIYGSSITQGYDSKTATGTWPFIMAEALDIDFYNLGFGGAAFYEKAVAEYIASRKDWRYLTIEAGTNTSGGYETPDSYKITLNNFLDIIRASHPSLPIMCFTSTLFEDHDLKGMKNGYGFLIEDYRKATRETVSQRMESDKNIFIAEGMEWLSEKRFLNDNIHPNNAGMKKIGMGVAAEWEKHPAFKKMKVL